MMTRWPCSSLRTRRRDADYLRSHSGPSTRGSSYWLTRVGEINTRVFPANGYADLTAIDVPVVIDIWDIEIGDDSDRFQFLDGTCYWETTIDVERL